MWANNEVGTVQPVAEVVDDRPRPRHPRAHRRGAGVGQVPVDFAASRVDAMTLTGAQDRRTVRRRRPRRPPRARQSTALLHGGGQERDIRSRHDRRARRSPGFAVAVELAVKRQPEHAARVSPCVTTWSRRVREVVPDAHLNGDPRATGCPATPTCSFPGCEGDSLLMLLDARGIECSTGSACYAGVPQASHVLLAMGCADERRALARCASRWATRRPQADVDALVEAIGPVVERARAAGVSSEAHGVR